LRDAGYLDEVAQLAAALGAEIACSRPVAEDLGWLPHDRYLGVSGRRIAPKLYLMLGISGELQHMIGVRDAELIVAVTPHVVEHRESECQQEACDPEHRHGNRNRGGAESGGLRNCYCNGSCCNLLLPAAARCLLPAACCLRPAASACRLRPCCRGYCESLDVDIILKRRLASWDTYG